MNLDRLSNDALQTLSAHLGALIATRKGELGDTDRGNGDGLPPKSNTPRGWVEIKTIAGHQYRYRRWYDGGVKRSKYLGKASE